jgi:hypothetical protein
MLVPGQIDFINNMVSAILKALPTGFTFLGIKLNEWCLCMLAIKDNRSQIVIGLFLKILQGEAF